MANARLPVRCKVDAVAITPKAAANSGYEFSLTDELYSSLDRCAERRGKMQQQPQRHFTPDRSQIV
jgi:hypothetical protein